MKREDEDLLIEHAKLGKQDAFTKLYDRHHKLIRYIIFDIVKNGDVADDLLSVTFTKAFARINSYVNPISFEMWLKTIAVNTAIDYIRSTKNEKQNHYIDSEDNYIQLDSNDLSPEEEIIKRENAEQLKVALRRLRFKYRNILELRYFKGLSYEQLAEELSVPIGTIKSDLNKAKKKLREFYNNINN
jgi:RNA polymerase sigma-70 factor (ECF subfamily)